MPPRRNRFRFSVVRCSTDRTASPTNVLTGGRRQTRGATREEWLDVAEVDMFAGTANRVGRAITVRPCERSKPASPAGRVSIGKSQKTQRSRHATRDLRCVWAGLVWCGRQEKRGTWKELTSAPISSSEMPPSALSTPIGDVDATSNVPRSDMTPGAGGGRLLTHQSHNR